MCPGTFPRKRLPWPVHALMAGAYPNLGRADPLPAGMRQAERVGGRPLMARCHFGLGSLYRRAGKNRDAREHLEKAAALFRDMGMRLWSDRVDAEVRLLLG